MGEAAFGRDELPYGVGTFPDHPHPRVVVALEDRVLDLAALTGDDDLFARPSLNTFLAAGPEQWQRTRTRLQEAVAADDPALTTHSRPAAEVTMHLPFEVADYVDFYASPHHATMLGELFRPGTPPLTPNWWHLPIGYHGRAGTVVVSGTEVQRPNGQTRAPGVELPTFGPSAKLDLEAELGWVVGVGSDQPVPLERAEEHLFGVVLLNDWSARDLQAWEYVPLGPFLGKSFATSISAWVLPLAALEQARTPLPPAPHPRLPYLAGGSDNGGTHSGNTHSSNTHGSNTDGFDIDIDVLIDGELVATCPYREMAWSPAQFVAHTTVNGATLRTGDLLGSGTVSGPGPTERGSLIELTHNGSRPLTINGRDLGFLPDGTEVVLRARTARGPERRLGEVRGVVRG